MCLSDSCVAGLETLLCHDSAHLYTFSAASGRFSSAPLPAVLSSPSPRLEHLGGDVFSAAAAGRLAVLRTTPELQTVREVAGDLACLTGQAGKQLLYVGTNDRSRTVPVSWGRGTGLWGLMTRVGTNDRSRTVPVSWGRGTGLWGLMTGAGRYR